MTASEAYPVSCTMGVGKSVPEVKRYKPMSVAARSKAWVCGQSLAGIAGSNPAEDMDVCLL